MKKCCYCKSTNYIYKGKNTMVTGEVKTRVLCKSCGKQQYESELLEDGKEKQTKFSPDKTFYGERFVITSIQNDTPTNHDFLAALKNYAEFEAARLIVVPLIYDDSTGNPTWDIDENYLVQETFSLNTLVTVLGSLNVVATAYNPISALESLSKGSSLIIPHNQLQMKSLPVTGDNPPIIMASTGTVSNKNYPRNKAGKKAEFNHSNSAIFIRFDDDCYHIRVLNADSNNGFYDIHGYYDKTSFTFLDSVDALITGDEHVSVQSVEVMNATYHNYDSIVNRLKPKMIIRHDVLDCFTISHHHTKDHFLQYSKFVNGFNKIEDELKETIQFIESTTPNFSTSYVVASNHNDHLNRWLQEADPKREPWNSKIFHMLTLLMLEEIEKHPTEIHKPNAFMLYCRHLGSNIQFIDRRQSFRVHDIELSNHGDRGANGSKGSLPQFSKLADKVVIGHSHTPGIDKGAYSVGCCTGKDLEYVSGPSSWMNTHCVIYPNGKRQLINVINGKWK